MRKEIDRRVPCFIDLQKGATSFHMVSLPCEGDIIEFATKAREESVNHRFIDGYFVGQFVQMLEEKIAELN